jgi:hypothetical protein
MSNTNNDQASAVNIVERDPSSGTPISAELSAIPDYEPPRLRYLGSVRNLTLGSQAGVVDEQAAGGPED